MTLRATKSNFGLQVPAPDSRSDGATLAPTVLVIDDDEDCLDEYREAIDALGYQCRTAATAREALLILNQDRSIGLILTDVDMPGMNGISLLEELSARFAPMQTLVAIVITGHGSLDLAVQAMRLNAVDFLAKPVSDESLSGALRRASQRRAQLIAQAQAPALPLTASAREALTLRSTAAHPKERLIAMARRISRSRQKRNEFLDPALFADPAWDMLLDLTLAKLQGEPIPVSSACAAAHVPFTTAFRYLRQLVDAGMVRRWNDPSDKRRVLLELEPEAFESMKGYLSALIERERN